MESDIKQRITEVVDILNHTDNELINKIPKSFLEFLNKNKDENYEVNINYNDEYWKDKLNEKTKAILALIYRDYFADKDEKEKLIKEEYEARKRINEEKYSYDNLFKKQGNSTIEEDNETKDLIVVVNLPWYKKLFEKIKNFFNVTKK